MIQNIIHQKIIKYIVENILFLFLWGCKMQMKMNFMVLEIWMFGFGKVLDIFLKEFVNSAHHHSLTTTPLLSLIHHHSFTITCTLEGVATRMCGGVPHPQHLACRQICSTSIVLVNVISLIKLQENLYQQIGLERSLFYRQIGLYQQFPLA